MPPNFLQGRAYFPTGGDSPRLLNRIDLVQFQNRQLKSGWKKKKMADDLICASWHCPEVTLFKFFKKGKMKSIQIFGSTFEERINQAIDDLKSGKGILVVDDENRENEGDLIYPAKTMTVADMALMIRECSGIVCLCLTPEKCDELGLHPMVTDNTSKNKTAFTISIEAKEGVTTGVSAADRIQTIRTAVAYNAKVDDLAHPGHVFPLKARKNGVLDRPGHTEGSIDIVRMAGMGDSAILCELTNTDGSMAKLPEIIEFAERHQIIVITIEDIIQYRRKYNI